MWGCPLLIHSFIQSVSQSFNKYSLATVPGPGDTELNTRNAVPARVELIL